MPTRDEIEQECLDQLGGVLKIFREKIETDGDERAAAYISKELVNIYKAVTYGNKSAGNAGAAGAGVLGHALERSKGVVERLRDEE